jgi:hypothetical protein
MATTFRIVQHGLDLNSVPPEYVAVISLQNNILY